jgi:hypothetical protein
MRDLNKMTADDFSGLADRSFFITSAEAEVPIELIEVKKLGAGERVGGAFSLLWQGPKEPYLSQQTFQVSHPEIGEHAIFLVPVAEKTIGFQYEAIFT